MYVHFKKKKINVMIWCNFVFTLSDGWKEFCKQNIDAILLYKILFSEGKLYLNFDINLFISRNFQLVSNTRGRMLRSQLTERKIFTMKFCRVSILREFRMYAQC